LLQQLLIKKKAIASSDNWAAPRGDYSNQAYSKLTQINQGNVKTLKQLGHSQPV
jgi:lanthanide-dependent methanol dehydrogenase